MISTLVYMVIKITDGRQIVIKKSRELTGFELDIATALALGLQAKESAYGTLYWSFEDYGSPYFYAGPIHLYNPTVKWGQAGGFIDEFGIEFKWVSDATIETYSYIMEEKHAHGGSHLESACRLIVVSLLGEEVNIPDDVLEAYNERD